MFTNSFSLENFTSKKALVLSIGIFDGVHLGHQKIIKKLIEIAGETSCESAILSFWPHPRSFFHPNESLQLLQLLDEKSCLIHDLGIQHFILQTFDEDFRNLSAEAFVKEILVEKLNVKHLIVGYDHRFGKNQTGDFEFLQKMGHLLGFEVSEQSAIAFGDENISSTKIRNALFEANITKATQLLGRDFSWKGKVIHGDHLGRNLGFPTANIELPDHKLIPKNGAYIVEVEVKNQRYKGMLNIGFRPTVSGLQLQKEVYILAFDQDIYGESIEVFFKDFLRDEQKFENLEALITQLEKDKKQVLDFYKH